MTLQRATHHHGNRSKHGTSLGVKYHTAGQGSLQSREAGDLAFSLLLLYVYMFLPPFWFERRKVQKMRRGREISPKGESLLRSCQEHQKEAPISRLADVINTSADRLNQLMAGKKRQEKVPLSDVASPLKCSTRIPNFSVPPQFKAVHCL